MDNAPRGGMILYNSKGCVLILKDRFSEKWSFPKGAQEDYDATLLATAARECEEESGLRFDKDYRLLSRLPHLKVSNGSYYAGLVYDDSVNVIPQESEIDTSMWIDPTNCPLEPSYLNRGIRAYLKMIRLMPRVIARKAEKQRARKAAAAATVSAPAAPVASY